MSTWRSCARRSAVVGSSSTSTRTCRWICTKWRARLTRRHQTLRRKSASSLRPSACTREWIRIRRLVVPPRCQKLLPILIATGYCQFSGAVCLSPEPARGHVRARIRSGPQVRGRVAQPAAAHESAQEQRYYPRLVNQHRRDGNWRFSNPVSVCVN